MKILGIPGSLRKESYNRKLLQAAASLLPAGATLDVFELKDIPVYNQDLDGTMPAAVLAFKQAIRAAEAILICTPEYNYSIPGPLKNAIDWGSRPYGQSAWKGKPVAVMGASVSSIGTARAQYHLRQCFVTLDMPAVRQPEVMVGEAARKFDSHGQLVDETAKNLIGMLLTELVALAESKQTAAV
jgi:chromate reductase